MEGRDSNSSPLLAVVLSRDPLVGVRVDRLCPRSWRTVRVASGYEAAAEILTSPVAALLVDVRAFGGLHHRLLKLAQRMEVQTFVIADNNTDTAKPGLEPLQRLELKDIPAALASISNETEGTAGQTATTQAQPMPESPSPPEVGRYEPEIAPASQPLTENPQEIPNTPRPDQTNSLAAAKRAAMAPKPRQPKTQQVLLTAEELAALLEDEQ